MTHNREIKKLRNELITIIRKAKDLGHSLNDENIDLEELNCFRAHIREAISEYKKYCDNKQDIVERIAKNNITHFKLTKKELLSIFPDTAHHIQYTEVLYEGSAMSMYQTGRKIHRKIKKSHDQIIAFMQNKIFSRYGGDPKFEGYYDKRDKILFFQSYGDFYLTIYF